jgi:hypothetical protein
MWMDQPSDEIRTDELVARAVEFLNRHHCMSLATSGPEGPWAATVFYVNDGFDIYFVTRPNTRHVRNLEGSPRVAATINDDSADWQGIAGIQLEGTARLETDEERRRRALQAFRLRYAFTDVLWIQDPTCRQCLYRLEPSRVLFRDHRFHDARFEIPRDRLG